LITAKTTTNNKTVIALENIESWIGKYIKTESEYGGEDVAFVSGDILFGKLRPYLAKVYAALDEGVAFGDLLVYRPNENIVSQYCFHQMLSEGFISTVDSSTYGSKMPGASSEFIGEMYFLMPPLLEQKEIVESVEAKLKISEQLADKSKNAINLMQERRTALISAAVSGKIDVRHWDVL
jgi:restriction endonuclease S subunit